MFEQFRPIADRVLIKNIEPEDKTEGGLFLPTDNELHMGKGAVMAVGIGKRDGDTYLPMQVKVGDIVYFNKYSAMECDNDHFILREDDILGIMN